MDRDISPVVMFLIVVGVIILAICATFADPIKEQTVVLDGKVIQVGVHTKRAEVSVGDVLSQRDIYRDEDTIKVLTRIGSRWGTFSSITNADEEETRLFHKVFPAGNDTIDGTTL